MVAVTPALRGNSSTRRGRDVEETPLTKKHEHFPRWGRKRIRANKQTKKKIAPRSTERLTLAPARFENVLQAMLKTKPPPTSKKAKP